VRVVKAYRGSGGGISLGLISGFRREVDICVLLGCYTACVGDVAGQPIGPVVRSQEYKTFLTLDGTDRLSRNVGTELPIYAV